MDKEKQIQKILSDGCFTPLQEQLLRFAFAIEDNYECPYPVPEHYIVKGDWYHKALSAAKDELEHKEYIQGIRDALCEKENNADTINMNEHQWVSIRAAHRLLGELLDNPQQTEVEVPDKEEPEDEDTPIEYGVQVSQIDPKLNDYCCKVYHALNKENGGKLSFARLQHLGIDIQQWCKENCLPDEWRDFHIEHINSILERLDGMCKKGATFTRTRFAVSEDISWLKDIQRRGQLKKGE